MRRRSRLVLCVGALTLACGAMSASGAQAVRTHPFTLSPAPHFAPRLDTVRFEKFERNPYPEDPLVRLMYFGLVLVIGTVSVYAIRHYVLTANRLFGRQRHPYADVLTADWPPITVLIPAHNEELVIDEILKLLLDADYPRDKLTIIPINDRSEDRTGDIIDTYARHNPDVVKPFHRTGGDAGKAAALRDVDERITTELELVFDADYLPNRGVLKLIVAPFFDPEVGAVMGRVIPLNAGKNFLTRIQELERSGGYQVDQQARMNLGLVPQYGGTVGGVRRRALAEVGGWVADSLTEDTDLTYRLLLHGHLTVYQNSAECYEEVPEAWVERRRQIGRWARGHNVCLRRYLVPLATSDDVPGGYLQKIDGLLLLGVFALSPLIIAGWLLGLALFYLGYIPIHGFVGILAVTMYSSLGNFAAFFQVGSAVRLDGARARTRLLPLLLGGFLVSTFAITRSIFPRHLRRSRNAVLVWDKTKRYRPVQS